MWTSWRSIPSTVLFENIPQDQLFLGDLFSAISSPAEPLEVIAINGVPNRVVDGAVTGIVGDNVIVLSSGARLSVGSDGSLAYDPSEVQEFIALP